jgi:cellulose synthase/poly-beta-1,6-N-acetylglucosamine synthase-like glycosyltransferase
MISILLVYCLLWLLAMAYATWCFGTQRGAAVPVALPVPLPRVSVLIAARNEAQALPRCLASLRALHYPAHLLEVIIGNDASSDATAAVAVAAMQDFAGHFEVVDITENLGQARGKANVLAHLARRATTEFFFITDADISLPPNWITALLAQAAPGVGTVTGITAVWGPRLFHQLQGIDWLLSLSLIQVVSDSGRPVTAMGNNMLVTRAAYEATGGYEALAFSVTEDYALFRAAVARGFGFRHVFSAAARADSLPMPTWGSLLRQRRRWLRGVEALPLRLRLELGLYGLFWPALAGVAVLAGPGVAVAIWVAKLLVQAALAGQAHRRAGLRLRWHLLPVFDGYALALLVSMLAYRIIGGAVVWKGRRYD